MIEGNFIINPIAHAYNLTDENLQPNPYGRGLRDLLVKFIWFTLVWNPPELRVPAEVYMTDWPMEVLARTLFLESDVDNWPATCICDSIPGFATACVRARRTLRRRRAGRSVS